MRTSVTNTKARVEKEREENRREDHRSDLIGSGKGWKSERVRPCQRVGKLNMVVVIERLCDLADPRI